MKVATVSRNYVLFQGNVEYITSKLCLVPAGSSRLPGSLVGGKSTSSPGGSSDGKGVLVKGSSNAGFRFGGEMVLSRSSSVPISVKARRFSPGPSDL